VWVKNSKINKKLSNLFYFISPLFRQNHCEEAQRNLTDYVPVLTEQNISG
jgi:hypothetical protein